MGSLEWGSCLLVRNLTHRLLQGQLCARKAPSRLDGFCYLYRKNPYCLKSCCLGGRTNRDLESSEFAKPKLGSCWK